MITESKVTEIFCISDDFCKEFEVEMAQNALPSSPEAPKRPSVITRGSKTPHEAHDVRRGGHHDPDLFPLQHLPQLQALLSVMRVRTVEASVPTPVLVQPFRGNHAALLRGSDNVSPRCLFRPMYRHQFC